MNIILKHSNGDIREVPIEYVDPNLNFIIIRWQLAGQYYLNIKTNQLTQADKHIQKKGKAKWYSKNIVSFWKAEDIDYVRAIASNEINKTNTIEERNKRYRMHVDSMMKVKNNFNPRIEDEIDELG